MKLLILLLFMFPFFQGCDNNNKSDEVLLNNARTAFLSGKNLSAEELYQKYLQEYPHGPSRLEAWERIYDITMNFRKDKAHAVSILEAMQMEFHDQQNVYKPISYRLAQLYSEVSDLQKSIQQWEKYMSLPNLTLSEMNKSRLYMSKLIFRFDKNDTSIFNYLEQCISEPDEDGFYLNCILQAINFYIQSEEYDKARNILDANMSKFSNNQKLMMQLKLLAAEIYEHAGEEEKARAIYETLKDFHQ